MNILISHQERTNLDKTVNFAFVYLEFIRCPVRYNQCPKTGLLTLDMMGVFHLTIGNHCGKAVICKNCFKLKLNVMGVMCVIRI